jgi:hypothetical protein
MSVTYIQVITRMNSDYTITNHMRVLDDMHYRPLNNLGIDGGLHDDDVLTLLGEGATIEKAKTTSQGYTRLVKVTT